MTDDPAASSNTPPVPVPPNTAASNAPRTSPSPPGQEQPPTLHAVQGPEVDSGHDDSDSAIGSYASSSTSITDSLFDFQYENGRRYHAQRNGAQYNLPNDESELDRLDLQHHLFLLTLGGRLYRAPLEPSIQNALDIGTGTGIWAMDFADQFPSAKVTGTDLSPVQPSYVPPNCSFYIENVEETWTCDPATYDYIHGRMIVVGMKNWSTLTSEIFTALKPGGWFEMQDLCFPARSDDNSAGPESPIMQWSRCMMEGAATLGLDLAIADKLPQMLHDAGFVDIKMEWYTWPLGRWAKHEQDKERGMWSWQNFDYGLQGFSMGFFSRGLGWRKEEVDVMVAQVKTQLRSRACHCYLPIGVLYARKPGGES